MDNLYYKPLPNNKIATRIAVCTYNNGKATLTVLNKN